MPCIVHLPEKQSITNCFRISAIGLCLIQHKYTGAQPPSYPNQIARTLPEEQATHWGASRKNWVSYRCACSGSFKELAACDELLRATAVCMIDQFMHTCDLANWLHHILISCNRVSKMPWSSFLYLSMVGFYIRCSSDIRNIVVRSCGLKAPKVVSTTRCC